MRNRTLSVESLIDEGDWAEPGGGAGGWAWERQGTKGPREGNWPELSATGVQVPR